MTYYFCLTGTSIPVFRILRVDILFPVLFFCRLYLEHVDDVLKAVEEIAGKGLPELLNAAKDESSASWPTLNRYLHSCFVIKTKGSFRQTPSLQ